MARSRAEGKRGRQRASTSGTQESCETKSYGEIIPRPTRLYGIAAARWRGPELIGDPAGRSGISLRQHPADPFARGGTERFYGAGGEEMATSSLHVTDGVPRCPSRTT
jgi:hypothetical protein